MRKFRSTCALTVAKWNGILVNSWLLLFCCRLFNFELLDTSRSGGYFFSTPFHWWSNLRLRLSPRKTVSLCFSREVLLLFPHRNASGITIHSVANYTSEDWNWFLFLRLRFAPTRAWSNDTSWILFDWLTFPLFTALTSRRFGQSERMCNATDLTGNQSKILANCQFLNCAQPEAGKLQRSILTRVENFGRIRLLLWTLSSSHLHRIRLQDCMVTLDSFFFELWQILFCATRRFLEH